MPWLARVALYAGLFLGIGGAMFRTAIAPLPPGAKRFAGTMLILGLVAAPLSVGLQGLDAFGAPIADLGRGVVWMTGSSTTYGITAIIAAIAILAGLLSLAASRWTATALSVAALAGAGLALASSGCRPAGARSGCVPNRWTYRLCHRSSACGRCCRSARTNELVLVLRGGSYRNGADVLDGFTLCSFAAKAGGWCQKFSNEAEG